jgi:hypothetical protein
MQLSAIEQATRRLEEAVARLESAANRLSGKPGPIRLPAHDSGEDVATRLDAVINRLDRVLEG